MTYKIKLAHTSDEVEGFLNEMETSFPEHEIVHVEELVRLTHSFLVIIRY